MLLESTSSSRRPGRPCSVHRLQETHWWKCRPSLRTWTWRGSTASFQLRCGASLTTQVRAQKVEWYGRRSTQPTQHHSGSVASVHLNFLGLQAATLRPVWYPVSLHAASLSTLTVMTFKALHTGRPPYLTDQLQYYQPTRSLCSSGSHQLVKPRHNLSFGYRAFRISAPHIWNSLPTNVREAQSVHTFRRHLKTHYFQLAFSTPSDPLAKCALILFKISTLYKSFTYLLT